MKSATAREAIRPISWNVLEYLALFLIVTIHEFGHALACRQVGGTSNQIVLWPLGGVAYVNAPPRPGATLWSIAAGPLVNVALIPISLGLITSGSAGWAQTMPNVYQWLQAVWVINKYLLIFNILPIYPLDGGQICALLWFSFRTRPQPDGRHNRRLHWRSWADRARRVDTIPWFGILSAFILMNCWTGLQQALSAVSL